ncbi:ATP-dependent DNA helicase RecG [Plasticicumulans lactativorans]|uniref:ATP-dependent DNA helicase RecG n=1 Tax=Plasticicumulans lactativorans TaxID=1133106 RepID=UPI0010441456|nr:ATP-dependent DNA helicase RecG [Plasticicumulans lactativorans]
MDALRAEALAERPLTALKSVGPRQAERLARLGLHTVGDLLFHLPLRYQDRTRVVPIGSLTPYTEAVIEGEVLLAEVVVRKRRALLVRLGDGTGSLTLRFFFFNAAQQAALARGERLRVFGEVRGGPTGLEIVHPEWRRVDAAAAVEEHLTPIYPTTEGLHQLSLRALTAQALALLDAEGLAEVLPAPLLARLGLPPLAPALHLLHRPPPEVSLAMLEAGRHPAQRRLAFEELLAHQLSLRALRRRTRAQQAPPLPEAAELSARFLAALPFALTPAQARVFAEIGADLAAPRPMLRLLQGDVGSGKTVVAALAALRAVAAGCQAAVMAPTELLAEQHFRSFDAWLAPLGIELAWLAGRLKGRARAATLAAIADGRAQVVIGTHALFQAEVTFADLGLAIIDEQHRFGVHQRLALREKGRAGARCPHQLVMTATPIPRTLAMSAYADLDTSVIDALPPGRSPVTTVVVADTRRGEVVERVRAACLQGRQAYWVCTLIDESEALAAQAATDTAASLVQALPELRVGLVHGRLRPADKEAVMRAFKAGTLDLLVATTVIEVGVDVPNASLMVIDNAERLGLAQLHQLRGRVGRGSAQSACVLLYHPPLGEQGRARLAILRETTDGFAIARRDLELRGPGEVLGTRQTGELGLRVADLLRDEDLLDEVQRSADELLADWPQHAAAVVRRWIGRGQRYGDV